MRSPTPSTRCSPSYVKFTSNSCKNRRFRWSGVVPLVGLEPIKRFPYPIPGLARLSCGYAL